MVRTTVVLAVVFLASCTAHKPFRTSAPIYETETKEGSSSADPVTDKPETRTGGVEAPAATLPLTTSKLMLSYTRRASELYARVVDVGAGLCVIVLTPEGNGMVFDAGHWDHDLCAESVNDVLGEGAAIDLLVLSHADGDHISDVPQILKEHTVDTIIWTGDKRVTKSWKATAQAIGAAAQRGTTVFSLQTYDLVPGTEIPLGSAKVTFVAGWGESPWAGLEDSDLKNVISVVARITYGTASLLLTGDTIGRDRNTPNDVDECASAEAFMVQNQQTVPIKSQVLQVPHHGGNNGSSNCFIRAVAPEWVVFSAGHDYEHPRQAAAERYIAAGVNAKQMLRTDRGDLEGEKEWKSDPNADYSDKPGDDDVEIFLRKTGKPRVAYASQDQGCS